MTTYNHALIDGDVLLHRALAASTDKAYIPVGLKGVGMGYRTQKAFKEVYGHSDWFIFQWDKNAIGCIEGIYDKMVKDIMSDVGVTESTLFFSNRDKDINHRYSIATSKPYKGGRKDKPKLFDELYAYASTKPTATISDYGEADDQLGFSQTEDTLIVTVDKDLLQIKGHHMVMPSYSGGTYSYYFVDNLGIIEMNDKKKVKATGFLCFCYQTLVGDNVDNYSGCPTIGPAKAYNALKDANTELKAWSIVKEVFKSKDMASEYLKEQAGLAFMLRDKNILVPHYSDGTLVDMEIEHAKVSK